MTIAAKDILNKIDEIKKLASDMEEFFYEHMIVDIVQKETILRDIFNSCTYLQNKLLLRFAQGYAKLEQREGK